MSADKWLGTRFIVRCCPECAYIVTGDRSLRHAAACSQPGLVDYVAQIQGPRTLGKAGK
jgi:hypothetical protein